MTISSINTNLAALLAQTNIGTATSATDTEVAQLSSGNRIIQASDDVAALATGTSLQSQVSTLNSTLTVASQASSLLQVADGALAQIESILQQQQSIATQAQSGSLSSTQLGFLNEEFQNLTQEINQLSGSTNFNGVNLINGSIAGGASLGTNTANDTSSALTAAHAFITIGATPTGGDAVTIDGVTVTFTTYAAGTSQAAGEVSVGSSATTTAANLAAFLNQSGDPQFANLYFTAASGDVSATYTGGTLGATLTIKASGSFTSGSNTAGNVTISSGGTNGLGPDVYSALGNVSGSILVNASTTAQSAGQAIDVSGLENNTAFAGSFPSIGTIQGTYDASNTATFSIDVGGITYNSGPVDLTSAGAVVPLTFTGVSDSTGQADGGSFTLNVNGSTISSGTITNQTTLDPVTAQLNEALAGVTIYQNRDVSSYQAAGITADGSAGVQTTNLAGSELDFHSSGFTNPLISSFTATAPAPGSSDAVLTAVINGDTFQSIAGIGDQFKTGSVITLQNQSNPDQTISLVMGGTAAAGIGNSVAADLTSQSNATAFANAVSQGLGISSANAALSFQVGSSSSDTIGVSIGSATTSALFGGASIDVLTQNDAATAASTLTSALNTVIAIRSNVGALESRFNFATNAIQNAAQNEGAAQSELLDTDVASTSTAFATSQVQLQAGIAVLAQANQLPQNLLKLIA